MTDEQVARIQHAIEEMHAALSATDATGSYMAESYAMADPNAAQVLATIDELLHMTTEMAIWARCWMAITWGAYRGRGKDLRIAWMRSRSE